MNLHKLNILANEYYLNRDKNKWDKLLWNQERIINYDDFVNLWKVNGYSSGVVEHNPKNNYKIEQSGEQIYFKQPLIIEDRITRCSIVVGLDKNNDLLTLHRNPNTLSDIDSANIEKIRVRNFKYFYFKIGIISSSESNNNSEIFRNIPWIESVAQGIPKKIFTDINSIKIVIIKRNSQIILIFMYQVNDPNYEISRIDQFYIYIFYPDKIPNNYFEDTE